MLPLTLALGIVLASLFHMTLLVYSANGISIGAGMQPGPQKYLTWAVNFAPHVALAWWTLHHLGIRPFLHQLTLGRRLAIVGLVLYGLHFFLSFSLSPFPYGEPPKILLLLLTAAKGFLLVGLFIALCKELPRAQRQLRSNE
jgi:hypothetical protein